MKVISKIIKEYEYYIGLGFTHDAAIDRVDTDDLVYTSYDIDKAYDDGYSDGQGYG